MFFFCDSLLNGINQLGIWDLIGTRECASKKQRQNRYMQCLGHMKLSSIIGCDEVSPEKLSGKAVVSIHAKHKVQINRTFQ